MQNPYSDTQAHTPYPANTAFHVVTGMAIGTIATYAVMASRASGVSAAATTVGKMTGHPARSVLHFGNTGEGLAAAGVAGLGLGLIGKGLDGMSKEER